MVVILRAFSAGRAVVGPGRFLTWSADASVALRNHFSGLL